MDKQLLLSNLYSITKHFVSVSIPSTINVDTSYSNNEVDVLSNSDEIKYNKVYIALEKILEHGKINCDGSPNAWFIVMNYIKRCEFVSELTTSALTAPNINYNVPFSYTNNKTALFWVYKQLQQKTLSHVFKEILLNTNEFHDCYHKWAFLHDERLVEALIICLQSIDQNDLSELVKVGSLLIPYELDIENIENISNPISIPGSEFNDVSELVVPSFTYKPILSDSGESNEPVVLPRNDLRPINLVKCDDIEIYFDRKHPSPRLLPETVVPDTTLLNANIVQSTNMAAAKPLQKKKTWSLLPFFDDDDNNGELANLNQPSTSKSLFSKSAPSDFVNQFIPQSGIKIVQRHSNLALLDDNSNSLPHSSGSGYFPKPTQGQSLASFLQTAQLSRTNTEIDRENAHFSIAEAMISAIEQIKWTKSEQNNIKDDSRSDDEKRKRKCKRTRSWINDEKNLALKSDMESPRSTQHSSSSIVDSSDLDDFSDNLTDAEPSISNLQELQSLTVSNPSVADHTAYAEWGEISCDALSAEGVALSLISKFSDKHLPKASDLMWLVSEQDAPQQMLPMPGSWIVNPDEKSYSFLRGTRDWAPPRAQIVFTRHASPDRKKQMLEQNQRCAGCGMRVAKTLSHRFRYCEYLGKYMCTGCHRNQISPIPARILQNWDFTHRSVCVFSYRLLNQIWSFPLFRVCDLNPALYRKIRVLQISHDKRLRLKYVKNFLSHCRFASETFSTIFDNTPNHLTEDLEIWSMADFIDVRRGTCIKNINSLISKCEEHIFKCELCTARGFICELCPKKTVIIFPWQKNIVRCEKCGTCYHEHCWVDECSKCLRLQKRSSEMN